MAKLIFSYAAYQKPIFSEGLYGEPNFVAHTASNPICLILTVKVQDIFEPLSLRVVISTRFALHGIGVATKFGAVFRWCLLVLTLLAFHESRYVVGRIVENERGQQYVIGEESGDERGVSPVLSWHNGHNYLPCKCG